MIAALSIFLDSYGDRSQPTRQLATEFGGEVETCAVGDSRPASRQLSNFIVEVRSTRVRIKHFAHGANVSGVAPQHHRSANTEVQELV
jgi:hypothetical protein